MNRSHNLALKQSSEMKPGAKRSNRGFKRETMARDALKMRVAKEWGAKLSVSPQKVNRWINGERIPEARHFQILKQAKYFLLDSKELEVAIDRMLLERYGPNVDQGMF